MMGELRPRVKLWVQKGGKPVAGEGKIKLLLTIERERSLNRAAQKLGMSYRYAWGMVRELERELGGKVVVAARGGRRGGGMRLTPRGLAVVKEYLRLKDALEETIKERTFWEDISTKLSARNRLRGVVKEVKVGEIGAVVKIEVKGPEVVTAYITREAAEALKLKPGDRVKAVIKATEVLVAKS